MKTKNAFATLTSLAVLVATLIIFTAGRAGLISANAAPAPQSTDTSTEFVFGGISIGRGQTASIIAMLRPSANAREQQPVEVELLFWDFEGNLLASETRTLLPGRASSFEIGGGTGLTKKTDLLPCIRVRVAPDDPNANQIDGTLQVHDNATGKTQFALTCRKSGRIPEV